MPMKRKFNKRRLVRKPLVRRRPLGRRYVSSQRVNDYAGVSETQMFYGQTLLVPPTTNFASVDLSSVSAVYRNTDIAIDTMFQRARNVAQNYQFYRIKYFELEILPSYDTFAPGGSGKPYLYYMIDKGNTIPPAVTNVDLKAMGAKPIVLDEKSIKIRWKPGVTLATEIGTTSGTTSANMYKISPWLSTNADAGQASWTPSQVVHNGIKFTVENGGPALNYTAKLTAHFQYKKPLIQLGNIPSSVPQ